MAQTKKITGNLVIDPTGEVQIQGDMSITGNLNVTGTQTVLNTVETDIQDRQILLNDGETGSGVTGTYSGIRIDRGLLDDAWLVFDESVDRFRASYDNGSTFQNIMAEVVDDTTPQLGGDLEVNGKSIISANSNEDIQLQPAGTGRVAVGGAIKLTDIATPAGQTGATILYAKAAAGGGTGLHFVDGSVSDELVSKSKAIVYGLIF